MFCLHSHSDRFILDILEKPILSALRDAGSDVRNPGNQKLERTKKWNFAGVVVVVGSSTVLYLNMLAYFLEQLLHQQTLNASLWGNPFCFGLSVDSFLNTVGMALLCGMAKEVQLNVPTGCFVLSLAKRALNTGLSMIPKISKKVSPASPTRHRDAGILSLSVSPPPFSSSTINVSGSSHQSQRSAIGCLIFQGRDPDL